MMTAAQFFAALAEVECTWYVNFGEVRNTRGECPITALANHRAGDLVFPTRDYDYARAALGMSPELGYFVMHIADCYSEDEVNAFHREMAEACKLPDPDKHPGSRMFHRDHVEDGDGS